MYLPAILRGFDPAQPAASSVSCCRYRLLLAASANRDSAVIPESFELDGDEEFEDADEFANAAGGQDSEVKALKAALEECWTLCNTLANLSTIHRKHVFNSSGTPDAHERAWKCCWKLCKRLYNSRDDVSESYGVRTNLDLCRDFCQSLFDVRQRKDDTADSILRVSFELNNQYVELFPVQKKVNLLPSSLTPNPVYTAPKTAGRSPRHSANGPWIFTLRSATD